MRTERVKALLWREWKLSKQYYISGFAALLGLSLIYLLFEMSMRVGNLKDLDTGEMNAVRVVIWLLALIVTAYGPINIGTTENGTHKKDIQANWIRFSYTLPVSPNERAAARMILLLTVQAAGFLLSVLGLAFSLRMFNTPFSGYAFLVLLVILDISLLILLVQNAFILRARTMKSYSAQQTKSTFIIMGAGLLFGLLIAKKMTVLVAEFAEKGSEHQALTALIDKFDQTSEPLRVYDILNLFSLGYAEQIIGTAKHLLPFAVPLTVVLYVLLFLVIRGNLKGAWFHDRSAL